MNVVTYCIVLILPITEHASRLWNQYPIRSINSKSTLLKSTYPYALNLSSLNIYIEKLPQAKRLLIKVIGQSAASLILALWWVIINLHWGFKLALSILLHEQYDLGTVRNIYVHSVRTLYVHSVWSLSLFIG